MNFHPIFVHFPIAFLTIYCLLEFIRFKKITALSYWFYVKGSLVAIGTVAALPTLLTGKIVSRLYWGSIVHIHSRFAYLTVILFGVISLSYFLEWLEKDFGLSKKWRGFFPAEVRLPLALIGLCLITVTGALGGILSKGQATDPIAQMVSNLLLGQ